MPLANLSRYRAELMGFAILWIMLYHSQISVPGPLHALQFVKQAGYGAVDIFFVLSGFGLAVGWSRARPGVGRFLRRRVRRVGPAYGVVATLYALIVLLPEGRLLPGSFASLLSGLNYLVYGDTVFWFVPAIVVLYAAFPALHALLSRPSLPGMVACGLGLTVASLALSLALARQGLADILLLTERIPEFVAGIVLGRLYVQEPAWRFSARWVLALVASGLATVYLVTRYGSAHARFDLGLRFTPFLLLTVPLCLAMARLFDAAAGHGARWAAARWGLRALRFCGTNSLELYLLHVLIFEREGLVALAGPAVRSAAWNPGRVPEFALYATVALLLAPALRRLTSPASARSAAAA